MLRYLLLMVSFTCLFAENKIENKTVTFQTDQNKNLIIENQQTNQIDVPIDQRFEKEIVQDYKPMEFKWAFLKMVFWLAVLIGFFLITLYMFKKLSRSRLETINQHKAIKVLEKRALSPKTVLYLVEYENKRVLIGESQHELKIQILDSKIEKS